MLLLDLLLTDRNFVKALPWLTVVREKLTDPCYSPWFLNFSDAVLQVLDYTAPTHSSIQLILPFLFYFLFIFFITELSAVPD